MQVRRALIATVASLAFANTASATLIDFLTTPGTSGVVSGGAYLPSPGGTGFRIDWAISDNGNGTFHYSYTFTDEFGMPFSMGAAPGVTFIILELSAGIAPTDLFNFVGLEGPPEFDTFGMAQPNPGIPGNIFGVKLELIGDANAVSFDSIRLPHWADFYTRGGPFAAANFAYNTDFGIGVSNPNDFNAASALDGGGQPIFKILAPNTLIPEPGTLALLGIAGALLAARRRRPA